MNDTVCSKAALVSVGGSPAPVLHVLRKHRPEYVWYFCSAGSREKADGIQAQLDWHPQARFIEVERYEELGPCYRELRRRIPEILRETHVDPSDVLVDYTGGTKTMSAALVLAATEVFDRFSYVGGGQREKGGLGVTIDGTERVHYQGNPWGELAIREIERARDLWAGLQFEAAAEVLREVSKRVDRPLRFEAVADLADATAARHRLDFKMAAKKVHPLHGKLPALFDGLSDHGMIDFVATSRNIFMACSASSPDDVLLRELLDNTLRTAHQNRFEDAAARLYRAMEMQGQIWLQKMTDGAFINGRCREVAKVPEMLAALDFWKPDEDGEIKLSLEEIFQCLGRLGHPDAVKVVEDISAGKESQWRKATQNRNSGILAHGLQFVDENKFKQMKETAFDLLGFELAAEAHPIPPMRIEWFGL